MSTSTLERSAQATSKLFQFRIAISVRKIDFQGSTYNLKQYREPRCITVEKPIPNRTSLLFEYTPQIALKRGENYCFLNALALAVEEFGSQMPMQSTMMAKTRIQEESIPSYMDEIPFEPDFPIQDYPVEPERLVDPDPEPSQSLLTAATVDKSEVKQFTWGRIVKIGPVTVPKSERKKEYKTFVIHVKTRSGNIQEFKGDHLKELQIEKHLKIDMQIGIRLGGRQNFTYTHPGGKTEQRSKNIYEIIFERKK
jgi:hypothetical protein